MYIFAVIYGVFKFPFMYTFSAKFWVHSEQAHTEMQDDYFIELNVVTSKTNLHESGDVTDRFIHLDFM